MSDARLDPRNEMKKINREFPFLLQDVFHHHWREGNIPSGARCEVCRRTCGSSDVLAGMKCEWCGMTVSWRTRQALGPSKLEGQG